MDTGGSSQAMRAALPSIVSQLLQTPEPSFSSTANDAATHGNRPGKRPAARGPAFYPRKRANTACQTCRARKTKCDNAFPSCSGCVSVGATCIQTPADLSSFDPASLKILSRLDDLDRMLQGLAKPLKTAAEETDTTSPIFPGRPGPDAGSGPDASVILYPDPEPLCVYSHANREDGFRPARQLLSDYTDNSSRICWVLPRRVNHILSWKAFRAESQMLEDQSRDTALRAVYLNPSTPSASLFDILESDSSRVQRLLDSFFVHIHASNPILDETHARRMVKQTVMNGIDWSPEACLTLLICALGSLGTPFGVNGDTKPGSPAYADSQVLFEAAQKRIGSLLLKNDLAAAQCLFLSGVYMMHLFQPVHGWRFFLQASAICQSLPSIGQAQLMGATPVSVPTSPGIGTVHTQEQAAYWSAWKSERELRGDLSMPDFETHDVGSILYPPFFPTPPIPNDGVFDQSESETLRAREAWLYYLADISLRRLTSRVCSAMLDLQQSMSSNADFLTALLENIPEYESQVQQWCDGLPKELSLASSSETDSINQYFLRGKMINFFEIIYWPFVVDCLSRLYAGMHMPPSVYEMVYRGLENLVTQIRINERGFEHRHHGCFFMIRSCTRSALVLLAAAKAGAKMPAAWETYILKVTKMQAYWEDEDVEVAGWRALIERELASAAGASPYDLSDGH